MHIIFDWDGTLAKVDVAKEAAIRRSKTLGQEFDPDWLAKAMKDDSHYKVNKQLISKYTGVTDDKELTVMMTDLFKYHYLGVSNELKERVLFEGVKGLLEKLKQQGHILSIATTLREDIVKEVLKRLSLESYFEHVAGNPPSLDFEKEDLVKMCTNQLGKADFVIGDKPSDVDAGLAIGAKGILVNWGTHQAYSKAHKIVKDITELRQLLLK